MRTQLYFLRFLSFRENEFLDTTGTKVMRRVETDLLPLQGVLGRPVVRRRDCLFAKEVGVNHVVKILHHNLVLVLEFFA